MRSVLELMLVADEERKHSGGKVPLKEGERATRLTVLITSDLMQRLKDESMRSRTPVSSLVRLAIVDWLDERERQ